VAYETSFAHELPAAPKSVELEQRLARLEICCREMQALIELGLKRSAALQAEVDHLNARFRTLK
jgi:hypothetical protein